MGREEGGFSDEDDDAAPGYFRVPTATGGHQEMEMGDEWGGEAEEGPRGGGGGSEYLQSLLDRAKDMLLAPTPDQPPPFTPSGGDDGGCEFFRWLGGGGGCSASSAPTPSCSARRRAPSARQLLLSSESSSDSLGLLDCGNDGVYDEGAPDVSSPAAVAWKGKEAAVELGGGKESEKWKAVANGGGSGGSVSPPRSKREKASRYERRRRDRINKRMRTLGKLVPNTRKNDNKECLLDKAIEHIKQLQAQSQMMRRTMAANGAGVPYMLMPQPAAFPLFGLGLPFPPLAGGGGGQLSPAFREQMAAMDMEEYHRAMASIYYNHRVHSGGGGWSEKSNPPPPPPPQ